MQFAVATIRAIPTELYLDRGVADHNGNLKESRPVPKMSAIGPAGRWRSEVRSPVGRVVVDPRIIIGVRLAALLRLYKCGGRYVG